MVIAQEGHCCASTKEAGRGTCRRLNGKKAYQQVLSLPSFQHTVPWWSLDASQHNAHLLPGGHAKGGVRQYLQGNKLQAVTAHFFHYKKPVAAISHGVVSAARSILL
ncbi:MAG: DJ-1 family [Trebouxia sp. A1-2]|nr:MAG: DJ-1 family [Trebouxia sp. A1-2]